MINLTLKQMRYFDALARTGAFRAGRRSLRNQQPALSMQIQRDGAQRSARRFSNAHARQVTLTPFGKDVLSASARRVALVGEIVGYRARGAGTGWPGRCVFGVIPTVAPYVLPRIVIAAGLAVCRARHSAARDRHHPSLIDELTEGRSRCRRSWRCPYRRAVLCGSGRCFTEEFVLVRPGTERGIPVPSAERLREMRLLLLEEGHCFRDQALSFCDMAASAPREMIDGSSLSTLVQMVERRDWRDPDPGDGGRYRDPLRGCVGRQLFQAPGPERTIGMIWRRSNPMAEQLMQVAEIVRRSAEALYAA